MRRSKVFASVAILMLIVAVATMSRGCSSNHKVATALPDRTAQLEKQVADLQQENSRLKKELEAKNVPPKAQVAEATAPQAPTQATTQVNVVQINIGTPKPAAADEKATAKLRERINDLKKDIAATKAKINKVEDDLETCKRVARETWPGQDAVIRQAQKDARTDERMLELLQNDLDEKTQEFDAAQAQLPTTALTQDKPA